MTALDSWVSTDSRPRFTLLRSNVWHPSFANEWVPVFEKLETWSVDPAALADDNFEPPSRATIAVVLKLARRVSTKRQAPTRVMPNGEGGIVFEWFRDERRFTWEIDSEHQCEMTQFIKGRHVDRYTIALSEPTSS